MNRFVWQLPLGHFFFVAALWSSATLRAEQPLTFENDIRPIFKIYCFDCHGGDSELKGGLDLRLRRFTVKGGESGPGIEPGNVEDSHLYQRLRDGEMPPRDEKLKAKDLDTIAKWIAEGAPTAREEPHEIAEGIGITPEDRAFWAFQPVCKPALLDYRDDSRVRTPIDAILLAAMQDKGLSFSPDADKRTLVRRASLDLTGLAPTPDDVDAFLADNSRNAYERMIDRLLSSPR